MMAKTTAKPITVQDTGPPRSPSPKLGDFSSIFTSGLLPTPIATPTSTPMPIPIPVRSQPTARKSSTTRGVKGKLQDAANIEAFSTETESNVLSSSEQAGTTPASTPPTPLEDPPFLSAFVDWESTPSKKVAKIRVAEEEAGPQIVETTTVEEEEYDNPDFLVYWDAITTTFPDFHIDVARKQWDKLNPTKPSQTRETPLSRTITHAIWTTKNSKPVGTVAKASRAQKLSAMHNFQADVPPRPLIDPETQLVRLGAILQHYVQQDVHLASLFPVATSALHIFVDLSNIHIGFCNAVKTQRGLPPNAYMRAPPFFFEAFRRILERNRRCDKRVLAGSVKGSGRHRPAYMQEAEDCGYETNILQRVPAKEARLDTTPRSKTDPRKLRNGKHYKSGGETATSGADSTSEETPSSNPKTHLARQYNQLSFSSSPQRRNAEQGVDELLHLKITQSILDRADPATMVIATGDAAEAEFSDGFKKNAERALQRGWFVEVVGWKSAISSAWRDGAFVRQWGERFRVIELDPMVEELLGVEE